MEMKWPEVDHAVKQKSRNVYIVNRQILLYEIEQVNMKIEIEENEIKVELNTIWDIVSIY